MSKTSEMEAPADFLAACYEAGVGLAECVGEGLQPVEIEATNPVGYIAARHAGVQSSITTITQAIAAYSKGYYEASAFGAAVRAHCAEMLRSYGVTYEVYYDLNLHKRLRKHYQTPASAK